MTDHALGLTVRFHDPEDGDLLAYYAAPDSSDDSLAAVQASLSGAPNSFGTRIASIAARSGFTIGIYPEPRDLPGGFVEVACWRLRIPESAPAYGRDYDGVVYLGRVENRNLASFGGVIV